MFAKSDGGENHHEEWIKIEQKSHQHGGGVIDGGGIHKGLTYITQPAHADELCENASAWERLFAQKQNNGHDGSGNGEAQEEHGEGVHAVGVGVASKDGESPKRGGGDGDQQNAGQSFHFVFQSVK